MNVIVVGAGASGMMAAIAAARNGARVTLLERNAKPGKKLLMTGNGRCNLTNLDADLWKRYHASDQNALWSCCKTLQQQMGVKDTLLFFYGLGLMTAEKEGYVYPLSNTAESVLSVLEREVSRLKVKRKYAGLVTEVIWDDQEKKWYAVTDSWRYACDRLILSCGSRAYPDTGSDGSGYRLADGIGHHIIPPLPSLCGIQLSFDGQKKCSGSRCCARVTVTDHKSGEKISDSGQVQWTQDGVSGIVIFQLAGFAAQSNAAGHDISITFDLVPNLDMEELEIFFNGQFGRDGNEGSIPNGETIRGILRGLLPPKLAEVLAERSIKQGTGKQDWPLFLSEQMKSFTLPVTGVRGFEQAQVCRGGVPLSEIDPETFESRIAPGLYFAGEILDADGPCGGYNLQWAWSTGYVAGRAAAEKA